MRAILSGVGQVVATALLAAYLLAIVYSMVSTFVPRIRRATIPEARRSKLNTLLKVSAGDQNLLAKFNSVMIGFGWLVGWPALTFQLFSLMKARDTDAELNARIALSPLDLRLAIFNLGAIAVVLALAALNLGWFPLQLATLVLIVAATATRHLSYVFGPLLERLRQSRLDPVNTFLMIAAADIGTFILGVAALFEAQVRVHPSLNDVANAAIDLVSANNLGGITKLVGLPQQRPASLPVALLSLLIWAVLVKSVLTRNQFQRTNDEIRRLALNLAIVGDFQAAETWLRSETDRVPTSWVVRSVVAMGQGNFEKAREHRARANQQLGEYEDTESVLFILWATSLPLKLKVETRVAFIAQEIEWKASDANLSAQVPTTATLKLVPLDQLVSAFMDKLTEQRYPLARSALLLANQEFDAAAGILERATPGSDIEEVIRLISLCRVKVVQAPDGEEAEVMQAWRTQTFPTVTEISLKLAQPWRSVAVDLLAGLHGLLALISRNLGQASNPADYLLDLIKDLEDRPGQADKAMRFSNMLYAELEAEIEAGETSTPTVPTVDTQ